ncbi:type IV toxin-antitoxin system AbiEi family antitoxin domain-containing protein [Modestobacter marinus]|uniref:type IV toxin-antitoxin system AbiEi family antitoxin domain-containing protein n=1 Tax=Modestobacter marinus TaxID=477641 RepID=UPI001C93F019|nr:type IV toxin-antitoxin system AbiEi family antitoxin domain-containing protein [Modestobacter marinus]
MHRALRARAEQRLGVFTAPEALATGYRLPAGRDLRNACSSGRWVRLRRGVYATVSDVTRVESRGGRHALDCSASLAFLGRPDTVVSHGSAAQLWGWPTHQDLDRTVRLIDPRQWRRGDGCRPETAPSATGCRSPHRHGRSSTAPASGTWRTRSGPWTRPCCSST